MPAGLTNLGNTCYMNATVQCLKSVPEFKEALVKYESGGGNSYDDASGLNHAMTSAMRDLYRRMEQALQGLWSINTLRLNLPRRSSALSPPKKPLPSQWKKSSSTTATSTRKSN